VLGGQAVEVPDGGVQQLGVGGEADVLGHTVMSTVTRLRFWLRNAPLLCATLKLSANNNSSLPPSRFLRGDNQDERAASIRMRMRWGRADRGRA
jgi:hypothetical protein